jgi:hypothetical protein
MIELKERDFSSFFEVPFACYPSTTPWVSMLKGDLADMLDTKKNPHWQRAEGTYFTAMRDGKPVGRIVAHIHHAANERFGERAASFGFFDCVDDINVATLLMKQAEDFGRKRGMTLLRGNMNLSANQEIGVLTDGDDKDPFVAQMFQPAHISRLLTTMGFTPTMPMTSFVREGIQQMDVESLLLDKHRSLLTDPTFRFRSFRMSAFDDDIEIVRNILNDSMDKNALFVPMTAAEARFQLGPMRAIMDPTLTRIAEHNGVPIAATICIPDPNPLLRAMKSRLNPLSVLRFVFGRRKLRRASVIIIVVKREFHGRGVIGVLNRDLIAAVQKGGYTHLGGTWIGDTNKPSLKQAEMMGFQPHHRLALFEKPL